MLNEEWGLMIWTLITFALAVGTPLLALSTAAGNQGLPLTAGILSLAAAVKRRTLPTRTVG
jgi:hypothetical protein